MSVRRLPLEQPKEAERAWSFLRLHCQILCPSCCTPGSRLPSQLAQFQSPGLVGWNCSGSLMSPLLLGGESSLFGGGQARRSKAAPGDTPAPSGLARWVS